MPSQTHSKQNFSGPDLTFRHKKPCSATESSFGSATYWNMVLDEVLNHKPVRHFTCDTRNTGNMCSKTKPKRKPKYYSLGPKYKDISLSEREAECMAHLLRGHSSKGIGIRLGLSQRTVESYIVNIRKKLHCRTKFELIDLIVESDFLKNCRYYNLARSYNESRT